MKLNFKNILILISFISIHIIGSSQIYPVNAYINPIQSSSIIYSDYFAVGSEDLKINISLLDINEINWPVYLSIQIEDEINGLKISTKPGFKPPSPIYLNGGQILSLTGSDLYQYLNLSNVDLQGITPAVIGASGKLPEGFYKFSVKVFDYPSGVKISNDVPTYAALLLDPPPIILQPSCEDVIIPSAVPFIPFNWQLSAFPNSSNVHYVFSIFQVTSEDVDPYFAVQNNKALKVYESGYESLSSFNLDLNTTQLIAGEKYVFRVRAVDDDYGFGGIPVSSFSNNGYSEWCWFYYGYPKDGFIPIQAPENNYSFGKQDFVFLSWGLSDAAVNNQNFEYRVKIHEIFDGQDSITAFQNNPIWNEYITPPSYSTSGYSVQVSDDLGKDKKYAWKVEGYSDNQLVANSEIYTFSTPSFLEEFKAGSSIIKVLSINNKDFNNLSGTCRVFLSENGDEYVDVDFNNLKLRAVGNTYNLIEGEIEFDLSDRNDLELNPLVQENGNAFFIY
ncbi:hypothetical protein N9C59_06710, partial [Flavobacteriales bacterium]|nr:hypothetical protein [Flavobacteriales bacterium]